MTSSIGLIPIKNEHPPKPGLTVKTMSLSFPHEYYATNEKTFEIFADSTPTLWEQKGNDHHFIDDRKKGFGLIFTRVKKALGKV